jgi:hypothetical protein
MLEMLFGLRALGAEVFLTGAEDVLENPWTDDAVAWFKRNGLAYGVSIFSPPPRASAAERMTRAWRRVAGGLREASVTPESRVDWTTAPMRRWFTQTLQSEAADCVVINYAWFASLLPTRDRSAPTRSIVDAHDLITLNDSMRRAIGPLLRGGSVFSPERVDEAALRLQFYESMNGSVGAAEIAALERFDVTLAITERDAEAIRQKTNGTAVLALPTPVAVGGARTRHGPMALLPMGPHIFNLQGYAWFVRKVLPLIHAECPGFELAVSGTIHPNTTLEYHPHVRILGFVPEPADLWALGRMLVNPVFGGTGQPIKTLEAMAAGVPPVLLRHFAHAAPLVHGVNGFIAEDEAEFAHYCVRLWKSPELCWAMGSAAMETVRSACSREQFSAQLGAALGRRGGAHAA